METSYPDENARLRALQQEMAEVLGEQHDPELPQPLRQSSARKPLPASLPRETRTPTDITTEALKRIGKLYASKAEIRGSPAAGGT